MRKKTNFEESLQLNNWTYRQYVDRLTELALSRFIWEGLPTSVDSRYLEMQEFMNGSAIFFRDADLPEGEQYMALTCMAQGEFNVYGEPKVRRAYSKYNNYQIELTDKNSVIIWNNMIRSNDLLNVEMFARRLTECDRTIDVNIKAQKTPVAILASKEQRLTMLNLYKEYDGNSPVIYGDKNLDLGGIKTISTMAPFVAPELYQLKTQIWNECLTYLGISNIAINKKERLLTDEVARYQGGTVASRYSPLHMREIAAEKINAMFGLNVSVHYREEFTDSNIGTDEYFAQTTIVT